MSEAQTQSAPIRVNNPRRLPEWSIPAERVPIGRPGDNKPSLAVLPDGELAIEVHVDEGRLEKIIFLGVGTLKTLRLKLDLNLPHHVFNRPNLIRQLKYLGNRHGVSKITFKLVPVRYIEHEGPQVGDFGKKVILVSGL